jgi:hypothetical protein
MSEDSVKLLADFVDGKPVYETIPAEKIGPNRYRLQASPGFAPGVANGDEIELAPDMHAYRVLKRSGNICIQLFLRECTPDDKQQITDIMESIGGWLDGGAGANNRLSLLIYSVPVQVGFTLMEDAMAEIAEDFPIDQWAYGNVYDTRDGVTPLNWWKDMTL